MTGAAGRDRVQGGERPATAPSKTGRSPRVALYSHDGMGIGHSRRNLLLAQALSAAPLNAVVLCIAGVREARGFPLPPGVDLITLPALHKVANGRYRARDLPVPVSDIAAVRSSTIRAAVEAFEPDVLIVDKVPRGALCELDATLAALRRSGRTKVVLGLRDVLDDAATVAAEWARDGVRDALGAWYDAVWVYGDPAVYDAVSEYGLRDLGVTVSYTGYLDQRRRLEVPEANWPGDAFECPEGRMMLCLSGGGQDGAQLVDAFARAPLPADACGVIVAGPMMPEQVRAQLHEVAARRPELRVLDSLPEPGWLLRRCDRVVAMGGYNTTCEILSYGRPALVVPRVTPRREQWIRATRLSALCLLDVLEPAALSPRALGEWMAKNATVPAPAQTTIDMNGLDRVPWLVSDLLARDADAVPGSSTVSPVPAACDRERMHA